MIDACKLEDETTALAENALGRVLITLEWINVN
jgi:hypothetical protein